MATSKSLKVGLVLDDTLDTPDGIQQYVIAIGEWLRTQGHDVHYLVGQSSRSDIANIHSLSRNMKVRFNGNRLSMPLPTSRRKLKAFLDDQRFDVIHVQVPYSPFMAHRLILALDPRVAVIGTFHILPYGKMVIWGARALGRWTKPSLKRFDKMLAVSTAAAVFAKSSYKVVPAVLPNVVDFERFSTAQPLTQYDDDVLNILFLGRLVPRKGCQTLLSAINIIKDDRRLPKFRVIICGKGPLLDKLQKYCHDNQLQSLVEFVGFVSEADKPSYYASADISVFPSSGGESFGIVLLEAMANGQSAVLAGDNPGYRSVLADNPELMFDPLDSQVLADNLRSLIFDTAKRQQMANWGQHFTAEFDTAKIGHKLLAIYDQALRNRRQQ